MVRNRIETVAGFVLSMLVAACTAPGMPGTLAALTPPQPESQGAAAAAARESQPAAASHADPARQAAAPSSSGERVRQAKQTVASAPIVARPEKFALVPVLGATSAAAKPLSARLEQRAKTQGLTVEPGDAKEKSYRLQGYFSAVTDEKNTTVLYVWDVLDPSGNRLHRINGSRKASGATGSGWAAVTNADMESVADQTVDSLSAWLSPRKG